LNPNADVATRLEIDALAELARRYIGAFASGPGRIVDRERHCHGWLVDSDGGKRTRLFKIRHRIANLDVFHARRHDDVARARLLAFDPLQSLPSVEPGNLAVGARAVAPAERIGLADGHCARDYATNRESANVIVVIQIIHLELQ